ncbi:MAG TPA: NnrS family protein [Dongiaceae bacterium]|nr:NnrS family protein [Dongiaceae bacterium]
MNQAVEIPVLLRYAFRPFFLLTGLYAVLSVAAWAGFLLAEWPLPLGVSPVQWHSHEMLYGLVPAAIAGFLLTAMTNWTQARPLQGTGLLLLILLWVAGRVVMWFAGWLPAWLVAAVDFVFLPVLGIYVASILIRHRNHRNLILIVVLALLAAGNLLMHLGFTTHNDTLLKLGQLLGFDVIAVLMLVIGGRIIPAFSANWLRAKGGNPDWVKRSDLLDRLAIASVILLLPLDGFGASAQLTGSAALFAGLVNLVRLVRWAGWRVAAEPLLWILHLAYAFIVLAFLLRGASAFSNLIPATAWEHLLGVGGIGTLILAVMTRVAMGHTGRPLVLRPMGVWIYVAILLATLLRTTVALQLMDFRVGVMLAALCWVLAFGLFVILYFPILSSPRADGRPG